MINTR